MEIWKKIEGWTYYEVSNHGRVRSLTRPCSGAKHASARIGRILRPGLDSTGYPAVSLQERGIKRSRTVHRLVAIAFIPNPNQLPEVNHKNTDKTDNHYLNLEWCTHKYNSVHAGANGLMSQPGERNPFARLSDENVRYIRTIYPSKFQKEIADELNVSKSCIGSVLSGKSWSHVEIQ